MGGGGVTKGLYRLTEGVFMLKIVVLGASKGVTGRSLIHKKQNQKKQTETLNYFYRR
jgi:hypothetical protein